jgi:hypothetical protein
MRTKPTYRTSEALTGPTLCRSSLQLGCCTGKSRSTILRIFQVTFDLAPVTPVAGDGRGMDIMSAASDTGMDDQLQGVVDAIPELAWSAGPDGAADFFNQRRLPSLRHS